MMTSRVRAALGLAVALTLAVAAAGCSVEEVMGAPDCASGGSSTIVAQSVPTAEMVPCFLDLPVGWEFSSVQIDENGTVIDMDSDRAGSGAAVLRYRESCDIGDAVRVPSDQEGAVRYEFIESVSPDFQAQRYYTFEGGCAWWDFDFSSEAPAALSIELGESVTFFTRAALNESLQENFIDEEL